MSTTFDPITSTATAAAPVATALASAKPLWAAVGVLSVAVLGMGGMLIHGQNSAAVPAVAAPVAVVSPALPTPAVEVAQAVPAPVATITEKELAQPPAAVKPAPPKQVKPVHAVTQPRPMPKPHEVMAASPNTPQTTHPTAPQVMQSGNVYSSEPTSQQTAPVVAQSQPRPVCINCGTVESVTPIEAAGTPNGLGAVAGGVLGAVIGHQVGNGNGRTAATILGALGGGFAGNAVEKNTRKTTHYEMRVRMEDGSMRTLEQASPASAGQRVVIENGVLRSAPATSSGAGHSVIGAQSQSKVYTAD